MSGRPLASRRRALLAFAAILALTELLSPAITGAQSAAARPATIELDNLRTPTSPAFTILGVTPTSIARPSTPRALALDLVSSTERGTVIPENYALEVAPYWLRARPALTFAQYTRPTVAQSIRQSFALSFGTARDEAETKSITTRIAIGARVTPIAGRPSRRFAALLEQLDALQRTRISTVAEQSDALDVIDEISAERLTAAAAIAAANAAGDGERATTFRQRADSLAARERAARESFDRLTTQLQRHADSMQVVARAMGTADAERVGLFAEAATAAAVVFPGNDFDAAQTSRVGAWATVGYRLEQPRLDIIGVARVQRDIVTDEHNALDLGGRLVWQRDRLELSGEFVSRTSLWEEDELAASPPAAIADPLASSSRAVATMTYRVAESVYIAGSFGRDHRITTGDDRPLIATVGVSFQLGPKAGVVLPPPR